MIPKARKLRKRLTDAERHLWRQIRDRQLLGYKFRRQTPVGRYVVDFICLEQRLIVELDGGQHAEQKDYDASRSDWLEQRGYTVLRFWNHEVFGNLEGVKEIIVKHLLRTPHPVLPPQGGKGRRDALVE